MIANAANFDYGALPQTPLPSRGKGAGKQAPYLPPALRVGRYSTCQGLSRHILVRYAPCGIPRPLTGTSAQNPANFCFSKKQEKTCVDP